MFFPRSRTFKTLATSYRSNFDKVHPYSPIFGDLDGWFKLPSMDSPKKISSSVIAEGIPPIPTKLLKRIQKWKFINLASLLASDRAFDDVVVVEPSGQLLVVTPSDH